LNKRLITERKESVRMVRLRLIARWRTHLQTTTRLTNDMMIMNKITPYLRMKKVANTLELRRASMKMVVAKYLQRRLRKSQRKRSQRFLRLSSFSLQDVRRVWLVHMEVKLLAQFVALVSNTKRNALKVAKSLEFQLLTNQKLGHNFLNLSSLNLDSNNYSLPGIRLAQLMVRKYHLLSYRGSWV